MRNRHVLRRAFLCALVLLICLPALTRICRITFFAPVLAVACYQLQLVPLLWLAFGTASLVSLFEPEPSLAIHAWAYVGITYLLARYKHYFFEDSLSTLPIMSALFSVALTLLFQAFQGFTLVSWKWVVTDLVLLPLMDGAYAFICFTAPMIFGVSLHKKKASEQTQRPT